MNVKEKAAASTAATKNKRHNRAYLNPARLSNLKIEIGKSLFSLNGIAEPESWQKFEIILRRFYEVNL